MRAAKRLSELPANEIVGDESRLHRVQKMQDRVVRVAGLHLHLQICAEGRRLKCAIMIRASETATNEIRSLASVDEFEAQQFATTSISSMNAEQRSR
jgi:hypothetical protein